MRPSNEIALAKLMTLAFMKVIASFEAAGISAAEMTLKTVVALTRAARTPEEVEAIMQVMQEVREDLEAQDDGRASPVQLETQGVDF